MLSTMMTAYLLFTAGAGFLLIVGWPLMLISALNELWRKRDSGFLRIVLTVGIGFVAGIVVAWSVAVIDMRWPLPFWETIYATVHSDIYGHQVEHAAETIVIFALFGGDLGAVLSGITRWLITRRRLHPVGIS